MFVQNIYKKQLINCAKTAEYGQSRLEKNYQLIALYYVAVALLTTISITLIN